MSKEYELAFRMNAELDQRFTRTFSVATSRIDKMETELRELSKREEQAAKSSGRLTKTLGTLRTAATGTAKAIGAIAAGGILAGGAAAVGTLGLLGNFTNTAAEGMAQLEAATGASGSRLNDLEKISRNLYKAGLGENYGDLTQSLALATQITQQQGDELQKTTRHAIAFRDVFAEDMERSLKANETMIKNFGITSEQSFNLMALGMQKGLDKSDELLDSANEYSPHFAALGFSANQMFDTFAAGLESGAFNLDKVGDAVKEFNIRSKDMSKTSIAAYEALGLSAKDMSRTFAEGGPEAQKAFKQVVRAISSIEDPVKKNTVGVELFGTMFEDLEKDVIAAMGEAREQFDMTSDAMDKVTDRKYDTPRRAWQRIGRTIQTNLLLPIGNKLVPYMNDFAESTQRFAEKHAPQIANSVTGAIDKINAYINKKYINNPEFQKLESFESKVEFVFDDIQKSFNQWWARSGEQGFRNFTQKIVVTIADSIEANAGVIGKALWNMMNTVDDTIVEMVENSKYGWMLKYNPAFQAGRSLRSSDEKEPGTYEFKSEQKTDQFGINRFVSQGEKRDDFLNSIRGYASGGFVSRPELAWVGEGKHNEWIIPENNSKRSRGLWTAAGERMGFLGGGLGQINYNPTIVIQGNADERVVQQAIKSGHDDFERRMSKWEAQRRRVSFK